MTSKEESNIMYRGVKIRQVKEFKYLGRIFQENG